MTVPKSASRIRQQIAGLSRQREHLEKKLISCRHRMLDACLVARKELAGGKVRKNPAYYLSRKIDGKTNLTYVRKDELSVVRRQTDRWREFSHTLAEWVKLNAQMDKLFRELGKRQVVKYKEE